MWSPKEKNSFFSTAGEKAFFFSPYYSVILSLLKLLHPLFKVFYSEIISIIPLALYGSRPEGNGNLSIYIYFFFQKTLHNLTGHLSLGSFFIDLCLFSTILCIEFVFPDLKRVLIF